jgi:hypothetical protein
VSAKSKPMRTATDLFPRPAANNELILSFMPTTTATLVVEQPTPTVYATAHFSAPPSSSSLAAWYGT